MNKNTLLIVGALVVTAAIIKFGFADVPADTNNLGYTTENDLEQSNSNQNSSSDILGERRYNKVPDIFLDENKEYTVKLETNKGVMTVRLFQDEVPVAANNFAKLVEDGFYDGLTFHRVIDGFMIQGGDPNGDGTGGPGYKFDDEPITREYTRGTLAYANSGPDTNGSQFFIMHADYPLPKNYVIFGELVDGFDTLDAIATSPTSMNDFGEPSLPTEDLIITHATLQEQ